MFRVLQAEDLEGRVTSLNSDETPIRGFEEEGPYGNKSYLWVRNQKGKTRLYIVPEERSEIDTVRDGIGPWLNEAELFGSNEIADLFYKEAFTDLLPAESLEAQQNFCKFVKHAWVKSKNYNKNMCELNQTLALSAAGLGLVSLPLLGLGATVYYVPGLLASLTVQEIGTESVQNAFLLLSGGATIWMLKKPMKNGYKFVNKVFEYYKDEDVTPS